MDYKRFPIGRYVQASHTITMGYDEGSRVVVRKEDSVNGQVVGLKRFFTGHVEKTSEGYDHMGSYYCSEGYVANAKSVVVWAIRQGMLNRPVYALDEDVDDNIFWCSELFPVMHSIKVRWTQEDRRRLREEIRDIPRDSKGRWVKYGT